MRSTNQNQLWEFLQVCWTQISATTLNKLIERMPNVCAAVLEGRYFEESKINKKKQNLVLILLCVVRHYLFPLNKAVKA